MAIVLGIVIIAVGLFALTGPGGARLLRWNQRSAGSHGTPGTRAQTLPGVRLTGVIFIAAGIYVLVRAA